MEGSSLKKFKVSYINYEVRGIFTSIVSAKNAPEAAYLVREGADDCDEVIQVLELQDETD